MKSVSPVLMLIAILCCAEASFAQQMQLPKPGPEFKVFNADIGTWDVEIKTWTGPGDPVVSKGKETNRMLGGFWLLTDFQGNMMGLDFKGHGMYSYDSESKQYVGTWVDSLSPKKMDMTGTHNEKEGIMTYEGMAPGLDGKPAKHVLKTKYADDGTRVMTMHMQAGGNMMKVFEMRYTKATEASSKK